MGEEVRALAAAISARTAHPGRLRTEARRYRRIVEREDAPQFPREARLRFQAQQRLPGVAAAAALVAARVERMRRAARMAGAIRRAACARRGVFITTTSPALPADQHFIRMRRLRIGKRLLCSGMAQPLRRRGRYA